MLFNGVFLQPRAVGDSRNSRSMENLSGEDRSLAAVTAAAAAKSRVQDAELAEQRRRKAENRRSTPVEVGQGSRYQRGVANNAAEGVPSDQRRMSGQLLQHAINPLLRDLYRRHGDAAAFEELKAAFDFAERSSPGMTEAFTRELLKRLRPQMASDSQQMRQTLERLRK